MRKAVGVALLLFLAAGLFFLLNGEKGEREGKTLLVSNKTNSEPVSFGIYSSELSDSGNGTAAVLHLFLFGSEKNASVKLFCSPKPIQRSALLLEHARAPGVGASLGREIERQLALCGISSRTASVQDAVLGEDSLVIAATGAIPEALLGNASEMAGKNSRIIVVESARGKKIAKSGDLSAANMSGGVELVALEPGEEIKAAAEAATRAIFPEGVDAGKIAIGEGNSTAAYFSNESRLYCRAVYLSDGACRVVDSGLVAKPAGKLIGPRGIMQGKQATFEFSLNGSAEVGRSLRFYAVLLRDRREVLRQEIAGGQIRQGYESRFSIGAQDGGKYTLQIVDQFGRKHASAYFEAVSLQVEQVSQEGNEYGFFVSASGEPVTGMVSAWIDSGEKKQFYASGGRLVVLASPKAGNHTLHFEYSRMQAEYAFAAKGGGLLETYVQLGIPALVFLFAVYLLLRAQRKVRYSITFPEIAQGKVRILPASEKELALAWKAADGKIGGFGLPCSPEEIGAALCEKREDWRGVSLNQDSVLGVLRKLAAQGRLIETQGLFMPVNNPGGFSPEQLFVLRFLHDLMVERGVRFARKAVQKVPGRGVELAVFAGKGSVLHNIGRERRAIVFFGREGLEEFESSLKSHEPENVRIKIALSNGKVFFVPASRSEIEPLLP